MTSEVLACSHYPSCKWEKKYRDKDRKLKETEERLKENDRIYHNELMNHYRKSESFKNTEKQFQIKLTKKKVKISKISEELTRKNLEINLLNRQIELDKERIYRLIKHRNQSLTQFTELENELERANRLLLTPVINRLKKDKKSMQSIREINFSIMPSDFLSTPNTNQTEQEELAENKSLIIQEEKTKNKALQKKLESLQAQYSELKTDHDKIESSLSAFQQKYKKQKSANLELNKKIEFLKDKNFSLNSRLKEIDESHSAIFVSDADCGNLNEELLNLDISHKSKIFEGSFEEGKHVLSKFEVEEMAKCTNWLENSLDSLRKENEQLKEEIKAKNKYSKELNKILKANQLAFKKFKENHDIDEVKKELKRLQIERKKLEKDVEIKRLELAKVKEKIIESRVITEVNKNSVEDSIRNTMATLIDTKKIFPEDYQKRRNIGSWSCSLATHIM